MEESTPGKTAMPAASAPFKALDSSIVNLVNKSTFVTDNSSAPLMICTVAIANLVELDTTLLVVGVVGNIGMLWVVVTEDWQCD